MVSFSASIRMNPLGIILAAIAFTSMVFYFRDMIKESGPVKKLADLTKHLKAQGYNIVGLQNDDISLKELLVASIEAAKRGGVKVKQIRESNNLKQKSKGKTSEGVDDPVTEGDLLSHREIYFSLKNTWPDLSIVSEERDHSVSKVASPITQLQSDAVDDALVDKLDARVDKTDVTIWIDPLDATKEYSENLVNYVTVMVCVAVKGKPVIGVIHKPFGEDETYWAWLEHGHNIPSRQNKAERKAPFIIVSRSHAGDVNVTAKKAFGDKIKVIPAGGAGYKVIELATGKVDVYMHRTKIKKWDICAGNAILSTLNGRMTSLKGDDIDYSNTNEGDAVLKEGLLASMKEHEKYLRALKSPKN